VLCCLSVCFVLTAFYLFVRDGIHPPLQAHAKNATEMYLSDESKIILCQVLCNEIQVYKDILRRAINFQYVDVTTSLEELRQSCPKEAVEESCSMERPNFHDRIERAHGEL